LMAAIVLGLLAPVLSFGIASGAGISALSSIAYSAQSFNFNMGIASYNPATGQGSTSSPTQLDTEKTDRKYYDKKS
jgi:hypothetical protein